MIICAEEKWIIMDVKNKVIAKGVPRNRELVPLSDTKDKKRILYYSSEAMAKAAFTHNGFYGNWDENQKEYKLKAVKVKLTMETV